MNVTPIVFFACSLTFSCLLLVSPLFALPATCAFGAGLFLHVLSLKYKGQDQLLLARVEHLEKQISLTFGGRR